MSVKINFEVGHVANLKSKVTQEGFTHDWELFVRSCDSSDISHFVEKVVFNLHESFPKPKRVVKEPPYSIKESGYAGFVLPVDIYFKCRDETKKLTYSYDLNIQTTGAFTNTDKKSYIFKSPSDDFRKKLLRGGGLPVGTSSGHEDRSQHSASHPDDHHRSTAATAALGKSKPQSGNSESSIKKYKTKSEESAKVSSQYANLFGSSGGASKSSSSSATNKKSPDAKGTSNKTSPSGVANHSSSSANSSGQSLASSQNRSSRADKSDREKKDKTNKHSSPVKEKSDDKGGAKKHDDRRDEKRKDKTTHSKERDRNREKVFKHVAAPPISSPRPNLVAGGAPPRSPKLVQSPVVGRKSEEAKQSSSTKHSAPEMSATERPSSSAKKSKKDKKEKSHDSRDRDRRPEKDAKSKEERSSSKLSDRISDSKLTKDGQSAARTSVPYTPELLPTKDKPRVSEPKPVEAPPIEAPTPVAPIKVATTNAMYVPSEQPKKTDKPPLAVDVERKHKHKKKDKTKEKEHSKGDRKKEKSARTKEDVSIVKKTAPSNHSVLSTPMAIDSPLNQPLSNKQTPHNSLLTELVDKLSSDSEDETQRAASETSIATADIPSHHYPDRQSVTPSIGEAASSSAADKSHKRSRKDPKGSAEKDEKKRKRKSKDEVDLKRKTPSPAVNTEPPPKQSKRDQDPALLASRSTAGTAVIADNHISSSQPPTLRREQNSSPEPGQRSPSPQFATSAASPERPSTAAAPTPPASANNHRPRSSPPESSDSQLQRDYMTVLKSLQHKIMTLQDHGEVQHVVEMIAETGCYEMTTSTFDFDLCVLDRTTVQRLLDYFNANASCAAT